MKAKTIPVAMILCGLALIVGSMMGANSIPAGGYKATEEHPCCIHEINFEEIIVETVNTLDENDPAQARIRARLIERFERVHPERRR